MILESIMLPEDYDHKSEMKKWLEIFRLLIVALKVYHKRKGIYENKFGYFGGITLALMAAKIIQLYPNYSVL
jgi:poly(A) polymerase Pap1